MPHDKDEHIQFGPNGDSPKEQAFAKDLRSSFKERALNPASLACIKLLEHVLADAKAGNVTTVGIVACGPSDFGANIAGPNAQAVYMGCGVLQAKIVSAVTQPAPDMRPTILRPAPLGPRPVRR